MSEELVRITTLVCRIGTIPRVEPDDDFYDAGFSSIHALTLLLELEEAFGVSIPDEDFIQARSVRSLGALIERLKQEQVA
jgi:acyl carrier protein